MMTRHLLRLLAVALIAFAPLPAFAQQVAAHAVPIGKGPGVVGFAAATVGTAGRVLLDKGSSADPAFTALGGDVASTNSSGSVTLDPEIHCLAALTSAADKIAYYTGSGTCALADFSSAERTYLTTSSSANLRAVLTDEVGTGAAYFVGGALGTPASGTGTNLTGIPILTGITGSSADLRAALSDESGTGLAYFQGGALGTPASGVGTNLTGTASGLTAGTVTTNANLTGPITSSGNATSIASQTGTGTKFVMDTAPTLTGAVTVAQSLLLTGDISPTQIVANTNDYAPTGFSTATTLRLNTDAARNITGLAGGAGGRVIVIHNVGGFNIVLTNQDAASTAANRFLFGGDFTLAADSSVALKYDATSSRWRMLVSPGSGGGGGGGVTSVTVAAGAGTSTSGTCTITTSGTCTISMADQYRQNDLLMCANQAKALAAYQRILETFCDGYKASDGVASVTGGAVNTTSGYVGPTPAASATLLIHADGTDASTTFTDAVAAKTITPHGDAQVDTAQSKFGGASALFDGTGDWLSLANSTDWNLGAAGSGDFTIDFWVRFNSTSGSQGFVSTNDAGANGYQFYYSAGNLRTWSGTGTDRAFSTGWTPSTGTWYHIAFVRSAATLTAYVDGVSKGTATDGDFNNDSIGLTIGAVGNTGVSPMNGWIDELRVLKGTAVSASAFPPSAAYSLTTANMTLVTTTQTADTTVGAGRVLMEIDPIDSITLNTDLTAEVTCDSGAHWASATLSSAGKGQAGRTIVETADTTCGANTGTGFAARIKNLNNKSVNVYKTTLTVH